MLYNPTTSELFTNDGRFLKRLFCPLQKTWEELETGEGTNQIRHCATCHHPVYDTAWLSEPSLAQLLKENPHACLKIDPDQANIELTPYVSRQANKFREASCDPDGTHSGGH
jgi:hypothetical protein